MAATNQPMIQLKDVSKIYDNGTVGLKDINLNIDKGEFVVVVGLSGAGKSTLLRSINRLQDVSKGDILIDGKSITSAKGKDLREIRRDIGMIFQSFNCCWCKQASNYPLCCDATNYYLLYFLCFICI